MEQPNPTVPANDIDLSKFVPAVGEDIPKPKRQIVEDQEDEPEDDEPVVLQKGPWEGAMNEPSVPTLLPLEPPPMMPLTTEQVAYATRPQPTPVQIQREQLKAEQQQKRKTESEKKAEEGIFVGAVKGLLGLEKKKQDAQVMREQQMEADEKEAHEKYELCKRLIQQFPNVVPRTDIRAGMRPSTYDKFIADAKFNLNSGKIFDNGKATAKWASKLLEIGGSIAGLELRGPSLNFSETMGHNIDQGLFDDEIREIVVFYPHFFVRPLWLRVLEKIFFVAMAVHEANSGAASRLMAGPEASHRVSGLEMNQFAG